MNSSFFKISKTEFKTSWMSTYSAIFSGRSHEDWPFSDRDWKIVALSCPCYADDVAGDKITAIAVLDAALQCGSTHFIGKNRTEFDTGSFYALSAKVSVEILGPLQVELLDPNDGHIFSETTEWGMVTSPTDGFYFLGGSAQFMRIFLRESKGEAAYRDEFINRFRTLSKSSEANEYFRGLMKQLKWS